MFRRALIRVIGLFVILYGGALSAQPLSIEFDGKLLQGALVTGRSSAAKLIVFGHTLDVAEDGHFVFGLGRDAGPELVLVLVAEDGSKDTRQLQVAQRSYDIQRIEGVDKKYVNPPAEVAKRIQSDVAAIHKARAITSAQQAYRQVFQWPAQGRISGVYGSQRVFNGVPKRPHYGLDIANKVGTPVYAPVAGVVSLAQVDMYYSGGTLIIDHGRGVSSTYIHLSKLHVQPGQKLKQGDLIAEIGATGRVTGPHLDWRINWYEQRLDPALLLSSPEPPAVE